MTQQDLSLDAVRTFLTIVDSGGFTSAAERLGRTQSSVSVKLRKLEETVGRQLLRRTSRELDLTEHGRRFLPVARELAALSDRAAAMFVRDGGSALIRLGVVEYFAPRLLPRALERLRREWTGVDVQVTVGRTATLLEAWKKGALDLVIGKREPEDENSRVIRSERLVWVAAPDYRDDGRGPAALCALTGSCIFRSRAVAALRTVRRDARVVYFSESVAGLTEAVQAGFGVSVLNASAAPSGLTQLNGDQGYPSPGQVEFALFGEPAAAGPAGLALAEAVTDGLR